MKDKIILHDDLNISVTNIPKPDELTFFNDGIPF